MRVEIIPLHNGFGNSSTILTGTNKERKQTNVNRVRIRVHINSRSLDFVSLCYEVSCNKGKVPNEARKVSRFSQSSGYN
jgi:hypothetical protein